MTVDKDNQDRIRLEVKRKVGINNPREFFLQQCAAHARELSQPDAVTFLRGMLLSCEDNLALDQLRKAYNSLSEADAQLGLIKTGRMRLEFNPQPKGPKCPR